MIRDNMREKKEEYLLEYENIIRAARLGESDQKVMKMIYDWSIKYRSREFYFTYRDMLRKLL